MQRHNRQRFSTLILTALVLFLFAGRVQGQNQPDPWKQVQDILKVEFPRHGFYPKEGTAFGSMPYNLLGQFFYGDEDGRVSLTLPLWVNKPNEGNVRNAVVRSGDITKEYSEYPVVFSLWRLGPGQTAREEIEKRANRIGYLTKPDREWKEDVIRNGQLHWRETLTGPFAWQRKDVTYHECPGHRMQLYAKYDIFELQAVYKGRYNSLYDIHKMVRRPTTMATFAGFEFTVSDDRRYCILCQVAERSNIHSYIPYASGYTIDNMLTTIAGALARVFNKSSLLDREISQAAFEQLRSKVAAIYADCIDEKVAAALKEGVVARLVNFNGTVVRDPGCGKPSPVTNDDMPLKVGDWLRTGAASQATVVFLDPEMQWYHRSTFLPSRESDGADGAVINIGENSEIHFADFFRENPDTPLKTSIVSVIKGWVRYFTRRWQKRAIFSVKAGHNLLNMRGTDVIVTHNPERELSNVYIVEGSADITNTVSGETATLNEHQQITVTGGSLGEIQPLNRADWDNLVSGHGLKTGNSDGAAGGSGNLNIGSLKANLAGLRFYESGYGTTPVDKRIYGTRFSGSSVRYVNYELNFTYPITDHDVPFDIEVIWHKPDGSEFSRNTKPFRIHAGWHDSYHTDGVGWADPGKWKPGTYRAELFLDGEKITEGSFRITGAGETCYDIPALKATVAGLRFYESGYGTTPVDKRIYGTRFSGSSVRYVNYELNLTYPITDHDVPFDIEVIWYRPDGSEFKRNTKTLHMRKGWNGSSHVDGVGWADPGKWKPGTYRAELFLDGKKIAGGTFDIVH